MSSVMNKGVKMRCKAVMNNIFIVLDLIVEPSTVIVKPNGYLEAYPSII